jgi:hypothetical protein
MFKSLLLGFGLIVAGNPLLAQGSLPRPCLHGDIEATADRTRRPASD